MPIRMRLVVIKPTRQMVSGMARRSELVSQFVSFTGELVNVMAKYPPAQPWKRRPPKTGPRAGGRRTGNLGRNWRGKWAPNYGEVSNPVAYAGHVQGYRSGPKGDRQTANMRSRGWQRVDEEGRRVWRKYERRIKRILTRGT